VVVVEVKAGAEPEAETVGYLESDAILIHIQDTTTLKTEKITRYT
jgi:hypothetical protein